MLEALRDTHVVVTGGAGFLGSHLCDRLIALGARVTAIDNFLTGTPDNVAHLVGKAGFRLVSYDVTDYLHVPGDVDHVLHFASPASPADYLRWPIQTLKVGSLGTHKALGLTRAKQARLLLASTSEVYGDPQVNPQPESYWGNVNPVGPRGVYDEAKRFAEALTLAYHREHGVDVRISRTFNSILADEQILYDDGLELRRESAQKLAERLHGQVDLWGYAVPAFDEAGRVHAAEATGFVGHPPNGPCFEVRTCYGRSIRVTGDHSLFVEDRSGEPVARPVSQLAVGDRVAVAATVRVPERDKTSVSIVDVWDSEGLASWDLVVRAPGLGRIIKERRRELTGLITARPNSPPRTARESAWPATEALRQPEELPLGALRALGLDVPQGPEVRVRAARSKVLLPCRVPLTDDMLWLFGLFVAEGSRDVKGTKSSYVTISCDDEVLERAAKVVERDLGLHVVRSFGSASRSPVAFIHSKVLVAVLDHLGFGGRDKGIPGWVLGLPLSRLKWFLEGYREGDGAHSGNKYATGRLEFSTVSERLKDDLIVALARFGLVASVGRYETTLTKVTGEPRYPFFRVSLAAVHPWSPLEWDRGVEQQLNARRTGDLVWAVVRSIDEVDPTSMVYDFCVPNRENFWAGTGVMAHNTYGPRMRTDDGRAVPAFFAAALRNEPLPVFGDGLQTRSLCYVDDQVDGLLRLLVSDHVGPVNIGNPEEVTLLELAEAVQDAVGNHPGVAFHPRPVDDPMVRRPDTTLAEEKLGWKAQIALADGLARTVGWFRSQLV